MFFLKSSQTSIYGTEQAVDAAGACFELNDHGVVQIIPGMPFLLLSLKPGEVRYKILSSPYSNKQVHNGGDAG